MANYEIITHTTTDTYHGTEKIAVQESFHNGELFHFALQKEIKRQKASAAIESTHSTKKR